MARFNSDGIDDLIKDLQAAELTDEETDEIMLAGAEKVKEAWRFAAAIHDLKNTGDMIDSIGYARKPKNVGGVKTIDIYPQGKDRKGVRNAEKAFLLHYGTSKIDATQWVDDADALCEGEFPVVGAMEEKFDEIMKRKGMK